MELLKNGCMELKSLTENLEEKQQAFLETSIGKAVNTGVDIGIRIALPDFLEEDVIKVKDSLLTEGFKSAVNAAIEGALKIGKNVGEIFSGNFESISQIKEAISKGGLIDNISDLFDSAINFAKKEKYISSSTAKTIKQYKNKIINSIEENIDGELNRQVDATDKMSNHIEKWKKAYEKHNFDSMEYQYKQIEKSIEKVVPLENLIKEAREIENLHTLIKNNGKNFNLTEEEKELAKLLK